MPYTAEWTLQPDGSFRSDFVDNGMEPSYLSVTPDGSAWSLAFLDEVTVHDMPSPFSLDDTKEYAEEGAALCEWTPVTHTNDVRVREPDDTDIHYRESAKDAEGVTASFVLTYVPEGMWIWEVVDRLGHEQIKMGSVNGMDGRPTALRDARRTAAELLVKYELPVPWLWESARRDVVPGYLSASAAP